MDKKTKRLIYTLAITNLLVIAFAIVIGTEIINPFLALKNPVYHDIIFKLRIPRIIAAVFAGMTLAASGVLIQVSMDNQLADTSILGFQSGATLMALIIMLIYPGLYSYLPLIAFIGGMVVYLIVFTISTKTKGPVYLIVCGIAVSSVIRALINLISLLFAENLENTIAWINGSLATVSMTDAKLMSVYSIIILIIAIIIAQKLDLLQMDDDFLLNLGVKPVKLRFIVSAVAILLASVSVSFVGTIGFVGLLAPHISRRLVGNGARELMPVSILVGSLLVVGCDTIQRFIFPIYEIPVGTSLSFIGGIYLIYLLIRSNRVDI